MGVVNVTVNNRLYEIGCDDGEEQQVYRLSQMLDARVRELAALVGQVGDARLLLMTALTLADDLESAQQDIAAIKREIAEIRAQHGAAQADSDTLIGLAKRLEDIAARLETT